MANEILEEKGCDSWRIIGRPPRSKAAQRKIVGGAIKELLVTLDEGLEAGEKHRKAATDGCKDAQAEMAAAQFAPLIVHLLMITGAEYSIDRNSGEAKMNKASSSDQRRGLTIDGLKDGASRATGSRINISSLYHRGHEAIAHRIDKILSYRLWK